jgi:Tfp pilus assembly protein PilX
MDRYRLARRQGGFALPAVLVVLLGLGLFVASGFHAANLELSAARSLVGSIQAFQGAEAGMALLESGSWSSSTTEIGGSVSLEASVDTLWIAFDGAVLIRNRVRATAADPVGRLLARREIDKLRLFMPDGAAVAVAGSWRETIRPEY